jgi:Tol biopolymer transport system component
MSTSRSPHRTIRIAAVGLALATAAGLIPFGSPAASATGGPYSVTVTSRVSTDGRGGQLPYGATNPALSADSRWVAFADRKTGNVYEEDLLTGQSNPVSVTPSGTMANGKSYPVGVSRDGSKIAFTSEATNLAPAPHPFADLYLRDLVANTTTRLDILPNQQPSGLYGQAAAMDTEGTNVAWQSQDGHVWARQVSPAFTQKVDVSSAEVAGNQGGSNPAMSGDGKHVTFTSWSSNLVAGDTNNTGDIFERDLGAGTTARVSVGKNGVQGSNVSDGSSMNWDGHLVAFASYAQFAGDGPLSDVFVRDTVAGTTTLVTTGSKGPGNGYSQRPVISADGKVVAFTSQSTNLAASDTTTSADVFVRNLAAGTTVQGDVSIAGKGAGQGAQAGVTLDWTGSLVGFASASANLVANDSNGIYDAFVRQPVVLGPHPTFSSLASTLTSRFHGRADTVTARTADLTNGRLTAPHFIALLADDPAWNKDLAPVERLYVAFFHRRPDLGGLNYWVHKHATGTHLSVIASSFADSSEFQTKYGHTDAATFVALVYQNVLERKADTAGLQHWTAKLAAGTSRGDVMVQFSESSEGHRHLAPEVESVLVTLGMLQRLPNASEYAASLLNFTYRGTEGVALGALQWSSYAGTV